MLFLGDIAVPTKKLCCQFKEVFEQNTQIFSNKTMICNFEGLVSKEGLMSTEPILFNHKNVPLTLAKYGSPILCLANNHIFDLPDRFDSTLSFFEENNIPYTGIGRSIIEADEPKDIKVNDHNILLFNACWEFLNYNHSENCQNIYLSKINESKILNKVVEAKLVDPNVKIVLYFHWNFDLETLPFPMYRQYSRALIDAGADIIVGAHSHCVQGGEKYKEGYIFYGIGNFFIPHNIFASGKISYPEFSKMQLVPEWNIDTNEIICHWFYYNQEGENHSLTHKGSEKFHGSITLNTFTPYANMNNLEYYDFFKKNRRKKIGIPIFNDYKAKKLNRIFNWFLKRRAIFARFLAKNNFINWQN